MEAMILDDVQAETGLKVSLVAGIDPAGAK
jgi:hypothetical protein